MPKIADLETPCVVIDLAKTEANLARVQAHATANGYALRPHIKTHKLPRFAKRALELGAIGITAQKLGEVEVMADAGLTDIFVPYNILGDTKLARLAVLNDRITISVTADSPDTVAGYARTFLGRAKPLTVLIECDTGGGRCGAQSPTQALALARQIAQAPGLRFGGLMTYPGRGKFAEADRWLADAKAMLQAAGLPVDRITSGNSPDIWHTGDSVVTERRPGTYIYFDRSQVEFGAATFADCALTVLATVVSRPTATRAVIDAGSKALSSDTLGLTAFGVIRDREEIVVASLSEEHGVIELPEASDWPRVGERIHIIPNHACVVTNLFDAVHLVDGKGDVEAVPVAARGRVD
ncbi:MAG: D-TA family PLP-dependent enzyme [Devosia sp.]|uniref:D-TA family PLP-dependent enzyme n=1 Tax=Devosia sp. TaxID=1871048 RepID=UPI001A474A5D|nr:D-TA family PLP-dependent enzyme [Devosia sp.]MBL8598697.1 D-TA family PLP-dependent enzyme [Devosia sp.]